MIQFLYDHSHMTDAMKKIPVQLISAPMISEESGILRRPLTADTLSAWLATNPTPGTCLAISNQPYVAYQQTVLKTLLPSDFSVQTVGAATSEPTEKISIMLDTLARILFQELQFLQKK
jgi:hypothetical protein